MSDLTATNCGCNNNSCSNNNNTIHNFTSLNSNYPCVIKGPLINTGLHYFLYILNIILKIIYYFLVFFTEICYKRSKKNYRKSDIPASGPR